MADFDFFDQFRDKMRSLRPSESSAGEDWQALSQRLDATMPVAAPPTVHRYRWAAAALLLLLLGSNLWWGFAMHRQNEAFGQLAGKVDALNAASTKNTACDEVASLREQVAALQTRLDEALVQVREGADRSKQLFSGFAHFPALNRTPNPSGFAPLQEAVFGNGKPESGLFGARTEAMLESQPDNRAVAASAGDTRFPINSYSLTLLPCAEISPLDWTSRPPSLNLDFPAMPKSAEKPTVTKKIAAALSPKSFRAGLTAGWLIPISDQLQHEAGYSAGLQADLGFSRRWSLSAGWEMATLHYKALAPGAAIGLDSLPLSVGQQFLEMDVMNQRLLNYSLGLRYSFSPEKTWHPYVAGAWNGLVVMPFMTHYEAISETNGNITKGMHETVSRSALKNYLRLAAGVEVPLGRHFDMRLEGSYLRQWRGVEPSMLGVRMGLGYLF